MTKQKQTADLMWGTPEHERWERETYGPRKASHPMGCKCHECKRLIEWAKGYQKYIHRIDR